MKDYISKEEMLKYLIAGMGDDRAKEREQGLQQGRQEGVHTTAMNALKEGLPLQTISKITNLPVSEVKKLRSRL